MDAYDTTRWVGLFGAEVGASAALTGLIFVAVSINLKRILEYPALPLRALKALYMLTLVLITSTVVLIPGQPELITGLELLVVGLVACIGLIALEVATWRRTEHEFRRGILVMSPLGMAATVCTGAGGATVLIHGGGGLYWLVPAVLLSFAASLVDAWVLLIEIER